MVFNILDTNTELWMTKYIIGEFFSSGGATLYKNPSDPTVCQSIPNDNSTLGWDLKFVYAKAAEFFPGIFPESMQHSTLGHLCCIDSGIILRKDFTGVDNRYSIHVYRQSTDQNELSFPHFNQPVTQNKTSKITFQI